MIRSKEFMVALLISKLLRKNDNAKNKDLLNELYCIISYSDLKGIEIYLHLENILNSSPHSDKELFKILRSSFLNELVPSKSIMPYETWHNFSRVVYCLEPLLYSYSIEREFFGDWHPEHNAWIFNFR